MVTKAEDREVWHPGEVQLQRSVGVAEKLASIGPRFIRPFMPPQHRDFFAELPFVVLGAVDASGRPWATLRTGKPGFLWSPDETHLSLHGAADPHDPVALEPGQAVGLLGIQPHTRRRNRANGVVEVSNEQRASLRIMQSFGNCPKYITPREPRFDPRPRTPVVTRGATLDADARLLVQTADTFFVASAAMGTSGESEVDVSHRGGPAGFVRVDDDGTLRIPDYAGNRFFNTLGNFVTNPVAGLLFLDYAHGHALHLTGRVTLHLDASTQDAERHWSVTPTEVLWRRDSIPLRWRE
mgnify:CR=1 FL=1